MDTLLSPRRRQLLQGLGAAALVAGCSDPVPGLRAAPAVFRFGGPTMGSTYTVKIAGPALTAAAKSAAQHAVDDALRRQRGRNADSQPRQIAIEQPDAMPQRAHRVVPLSGLAMAIGVIFRRPCLRGSCGGQAAATAQGERLSCATCPNRHRATGLH